MTDLDGREPFVSFQLYLEAKSAATNPLTSYSTRKALEGEVVDRCWGNAKGGSAIHVCVWWLWPQELPSLPRFCAEVPLPLQRVAYQWVMSTFPSAFALPIQGWRVWLWSQIFLAVSTQVAQQILRCFDWLHPGVRAGMSLTRELPEKAPPMFCVTSILFSSVNISGACSVSDIIINWSE